MIGMNTVFLILALSIVAGNPWLYRSNYQCMRKNRMAVTNRNRRAWPSSRQASLRDPARAQV
jgi:hypothetical protein